MECKILKVEDWCFPSHQQRESCFLFFTQVIMLAVCFQITSIINSPRNISYYEKEYRIVMQALGAVSVIVCQSKFSSMNIEIFNFQSRLGLNLLGYEFSCRRNLYTTTQLKVCSHSTESVEWRRRWWQTISHFHSFLRLSSFLSVGIVVLSLVHCEKD